MNINDKEIISKIVYSDEYFLAINKPSGLVVHSDGRTEEKTLVDWLKENYSDLKNIGNPHTLDSERYTERWGMVNRLDRETSGIILIAKTQGVFENLQKQFLERVVMKEYIAKCWVDQKTPLPPLKGGITEPISRHKKDPRIWVCGKNVGERLTTRDAETDYEVLTPGQSGGINTILLRMFPKTGRTHQLRLHARFLGMPIVGDKKYGINGITNEHSTTQIDSLLNFLKSPQPPLKGGSSAFEIDKNSRLMLHAKSLEFLHPKTLEKIKIETDLPQDFI